MGLSKDHIEKAAEAAYMRYREVDVERRRTLHSWKLLHSSVHNDWCDAVEAATPFLQMPIAEVLEEECISIANATNSKTSSIGLILETFRTIRNAALQPKPDLREQLVSQIKLGMELGVDSETLAENLLAIPELKAIIDAHKGEK